MMHYRKKNKKSYGFLFLAIFLILFFGFVGIMWPQTVARTVTNPIYTIKQLASKPFVGLYTAFRSKQDLEAKVSSLEDELTKTKLSLLSQSFANSQNDDYQIELEKNLQGSISKVLNRPPFSPYDTLLILKGENQIDVGDLVYIHGLYIGEIVSTDVFTATVKLRSSAGEKTLVRVSDIEAEAEGKSGGQFIIKIPKDLDVEIGDAVMVPQLDYDLLGSVGQIVEDPVATFKTIYFSIPISFQSMNFVSVVKKQSVLE